MLDGHVVKVGPGYLSTFSSSVLEELLILDLLPVVSDIRSIRLYIYIVKED